MADPHAPRNFNCPMTEAPCVEPTCKRDFCVAKQREEAEALEAEERARQLRIRHGRATWEDVGL